MPQVRSLFGIFDFRVGQRRLTGRTPVDDPVSAVDYALFVEIYEHFEHRLGTALVHGERLARPVARRTETTELLFYPAAVFLFPCPRAFQKTFSADVFFGKPLFFLHVLDDLDLGRDRRVIGARQPERAIPAHTLVTYDDVLYRLVERMPHMQLPRYVGRRHHDGERLFLLVYLCGEIALALPLLVQSAFEILRIVGLLHIHNKTSLLSPFYLFTCLFRFLRYVFGFTRKATRSALRRPIPSLRRS